MRDATRDGRRGKTYVCPASVGSVVEAAGIVLLDRSRGAARELAYPEAAVWEVLSRGRSFERAARMLCAIARPRGDRVDASELGMEEARRLVARCTASWTAEGFLQEAESGG